MFGRKMRASISRLTASSSVLPSSAAHSSSPWQRQGDVFLFNTHSSNDKKNGFGYIKDGFSLRSALAKRSKLGFRNPADSVTLFDRMVEIQHVSTIHDFNELFTILARFKLYSNAIYLIKRLRVLGGVPSIDDFTLNVMLNCYCRLDRVHYGYAVIGSLFKHGYAPHEYAFTVLINALIGQDRVAESLELFNRVLVSERRDINSFKWITHAAHMNAHFKTGDIREATKALNKIEFDTLPPEPSREFVDSIRVVYNTVIDGLCKLGHVDLARKNFFFWGMVKLLQIPPNVITFNSLIQGYASLGRWDDVNRVLFHEMIESNNLPDEYTFCILMDALGNDRRGEVHDMLLDVEVQALPSSCPRHMPYGSGSVNAHYTLRDRAETVLKIMSFVNADLFAYNSVMKRFCLDDRMEEALQLFKALGTRGFHPNISSYNILIGAYCDRVELDEALQLYGEIPLQGLRPNKETYNSLLKGLLMAGRCGDAECILHDMVRRGKAPDRYMYSSLLDSLLCVEDGCEAGKLEESSALWYKWLKPDFCHEELVNQAEKLLLDELEVIS